MTIHWDPWHTVTVTEVVVRKGNAKYEDDIEPRYAVTHPEPHENGCPKHCMTQQEIDERLGEELPTVPGVYEIRAWGEYWPATMAGDPAEFDGGIEVRRLNEAVAR